MMTIIAKHPRSMLRLSLVGIMLLLGFALAGVLEAATGETAKNPAKFDHLKTGFPLDGVHARLKCEDCHIQGVFKGTPNKCSICHSPGSRTGASSMSATHIPTTLPCENCHKSAVSWTGARFTHADVRPGSCKTCHDGVTAPGKTSGHVVTNESCDTCHRTTAWQPAGFNHMGVLPGSCKSCHGVTPNVTAKSNNHIPTNDSCDVCHRTTTWITKYHESVQAAPGACGTCHGTVPGVTAKTASPPHPVTTASCDTCHTNFISFAMTPGAFVHPAVAAGSCASCHNGSTAKGKSSTHIPTTAACDVCHKISGLFQDGRYHANVVATTGGCATCHGPNPNVKAKGNTHIPTTASCDVCHKVTGLFQDGLYHAKVTATPGACATCHGPNPNVTAKTASPPHPVTAASCDTCHTNFTSFVMSATGFVHPTVAPGTCASCHNGSTAKGKSGSHIPTTASCDTCHKITGSFLDGMYHKNVQATPGGCASCHGTNPNVTAKSLSNHIPTTASCDVCHSVSGGFLDGRYHAFVQATPGTCSTCHGKVPGVTAKTASPPHPVTSAECDTCHTGFASFAMLGHPTVLPGSCASCHGITAKGKSGTHIPTTASCDLCHKITGAFLDGMYHKNVSATPGGCATCHGFNPNVTAKPPGHFLTTLSSCDACHVIAAWASPIKYSHTTPSYRAHSAGVLCDDCHKQKSQVITWAYSAYKPDCAGCHAGDYKQSKHEKASGGTYTVLELKDCTGACHEPAGHHRPTDSSFNK